MPGVSPRASIELSGLSTSSSTTNGADQNTSTAITAAPHNVGIFIVVPGRHGGNIPFVFYVPVDATGEEFMIKLREYLYTVVFTSRHVRCYPRITGLLLRETVRLGTVSSLVAPPVPGHQEGHVWPVDMLLSETMHSSDFAAGYRWPPALRQALRFPEHPVFRTENNDRRVIVVSQEASPVKIAIGVCISVFLALIDFALIAGVVGRWDIAAGTATVIFAVLNLLQGLVFWLLRQFTP